MKTTSCGILILNKDNKILLGHVTGQKHWDLPKGLNENNENYMDTAIRETLEETSLKIDKTKCKKLGEFNYNKSKNLVLFVYKIEEIKMNELKCSSNFVNHYTKKDELEIDGFQLFSFEEAKTKVCSSMKKVLESLNYNEIIY